MKYDEQRIDRARDMNESFCATGGINGWPQAICNFATQEVELDRASRPASVGRETLEQLEWAWTIIANAYGGDWGYATPQWREGAGKWRDKWHEILSTPSEPQAGSREQREAIWREACEAASSELFKLCGWTPEHFARRIVERTPYPPAPVKPMSPFGCECWEPSISVGWKIDSLPFAEWMTHCAKCGHARTPAVGQGEAR